MYEITKKKDFSKDYSLVDQIRRASISVLSNIAEGFERGSNKEFIQFLYISKGSCGEVRSQL
jgi:four helix bundle protein